MKQLAALIFLTISFSACIKQNDYTLGEFPYYGGEDLFMIGDPFITQTNGFPIDSTKKDISLRITVLFDKLEKSVANTVEISVTKDGKLIDSWTKYKAANFYFPAQKVGVKDEYEIYMTHRFSQPSKKMKFIVEAR